MTRRAKLMKPLQSSSRSAKQSQEKCAHVSHSTIFSTFPGDQQVGNEVGSTSLLPRLAQDGVAAKGSLFPARSNAMR